jgi:hypothetical protein
MPYSDDAPKAWALDRIHELWRATTCNLGEKVGPTGDPFHVLDVGAGAGSWGRSLRERYTITVEVDCIEAHGPYVERFQLGALYDHVFVGDVRQWDWGGCEYVTVAESDQPVGQGIPTWTWDLVILGDVLEHMTKPEALAVVDQALVHADAVLVVVPLGEWPQGPEEGNPLEAHVSTWELPDLDDLPKMVRSEVTILPDSHRIRDRRKIAALCLGVWP